MITEKSTPTDLAATPSAPGDVGPAAGPVVLFDGECGLCNRSVDFVIRRDRRGLVRFAARQTPAGQRLARQHGFGDELGSMILIEDGVAHERSTAALKICRHLRLPWRLMSVFLLVPRMLRDAVYGCVARSRNRWFGGRQQCRVPAPGDRVRFLLEGESPSSHP